jgi:hypothetical protein
MADNTENMVLRTLYLPLETDRHLKALAFTRDVSKGELMRDLITQGLATIAASGERSLAQQLSARIAQAQPVAAEKKERSAAKPAAAPRARAGAASSRRGFGKARELVAAG